MRRAIALALAVVLLMWGTPRAERKVSIDQPITVRLDVGQPTAIILPEEILGIGVMVDPERLSLE